MELLLEKGAAVNLQNVEQMAPLHYAAMQPLPTSLQVLLASKHIYIQYIYMGIVHSDDMFLQRGVVCINPSVCVCGES